MSQVLPKKLLCRKIGTNIADEIAVEIMWLKILQLSR